MSRQRTDKLTRQWDAVPTERQDAYRRAYQREVRAAGAGSDDAAELAVLQRLIDAYRQQALVPVGSRWVSVPERVRLAARRDRPLTATNDDLIRPDSQRAPRLLGLLLLPLAGLLLWVLMTQTGDRHDETAAGPGALAAPGTLAAPTITLTPSASPTPTPLALEASDTVIRAGDRAGDSSRRRPYYPVLLQVYPADGAPSRVFVVQERAVQTADWRFDPNPDVASWVSGLLVRPVLGLPFSDDNAALMADLSPGARFELQMNTGATLRFVYSGARQVTRQETAIFSQIAPGLTLVLIGATDADGAPTETRRVVEAVYPVEQEIERLRAGELAAVVPPGQPAPLAGLDDVTLAVDATALRAPDGLPPELGYALVDVTLATGSERLSGGSLPSGSLNWVLETADGGRFNRDPNAETQGDFAPLPDSLPPGSAFAASLGFLAPRDLTTARLLVTAPSGELTAFALTFDPPPAPATSAGLDLQLRRVSYDATTLVVEARVFNPQTQAVALADATPWLVTGYASAPLGPLLPPLGGSLPDAIAPGAAFDLELTFPYGGEPYGRLLLLEREYALAITASR